MTPEQLVHQAAAEASSLYLTAADVTSLHNLLVAQEYDLRNLREANTDWADTAANLRDEVARWANRVYTIADDLAEARSALKFANDTGELLLAAARLALTR